MHYLFNLLDATHRRKLLMMHFFILPKEQEAKVVINDGITIEADFRFYEK